MTEYITEWYWDERRNAPNQAQREEIVRCRNCAKFSEQEPGGEIGICNLGLEDTGLVSIVEPNGFCAWPERRTE